MVKCAFCISFRVATQACTAYILIASDTLVFAIHLCLGMAGPCAGKHCKIRSICMTFRTTGPRSFMLSCIDREILPVVVEVGRCPCRLGVAFGAGCGELGCFMIWIFCLVVFSCVTPGAGIRGSGIVAFMTISTSEGYMCAGQHIEGIVIGESSWLPAGLGSVAGSTFFGNVLNNMVWIDRLVVICLVTTDTF